MESMFQRRKKSHSVRPKQPNAKFGSPHPDNQKTRVVGPNQKKVVSPNLLGADVKSISEEGADVKSISEEVQAYRWPKDGGSRPMTNFGDISTAKLTVILAKKFLILLYMSDNYWKQYIQGWLQGDHFLKETEKFFFST